MTNLKEDEIFAIADHFGLDSQLKQLIEEMAELTQAICKYFRFNSDRYLPITEEEMERNLFEELADVTLMLYQVVYLLGCDEVVGEIANKKVKRTLERIQHGLIHKENNKMSKYGPGLSTKDVCKLECKEAKRILKKYCVSKEDVKIITNMIKEAYFELGVAFQSGTATYKVTMELAEKLGIKENEVFKRYMSYMSKLDEEAKND